jgi:uncharacterized SAM-binding protein YcdF (DUF218 family)
MFVFLSKLLPLLVYPLGLGCLLLLISLLIRNKSKWRVAVVVAAFVILWLGGNRWVAMGLARSLEWRHLPEGDQATAEVIVVLGGGTEPAQYPRSQVEVNSAADRMLYAASLYRTGKAPHILLSGGNISWLEDAESSPAADMAALLSMLGVPPEAIWLESKSLNTYENALYTRQFLEEQDINQILLVTSALHMPRAVALFEKQGLEVIPAPADFTVTQEGWASLFSGPIQPKIIYLLPNASSLALTTNVLKEYLGMLVYWLRGWV